MPARYSGLGMSFSGTLSDVTMDHAWPQPEHHHAPGLPLGPMLGSREVVTFDPLTLIMTGILTSPIVHIFGNMGYGKSAFIKMLLMWIFMLDMGGRRATISYDNHRNPDGKPEVEELNKFIGTQSTRLADQQLNIYHSYYGMVPWEQLVLTSSLLADMEGTPLTRHMPFILEVALDKMARTRPDQSSGMQLADLVIKLEPEDVESYYTATRKRLFDVTSLADRLVEAPIELRHVRQNFHEFSQDALLLSERLVRLVSGNGPTGHLFGDKHHIVTSEEGNLSLDYTGLDDLQKGMVIGFIQQIRNSAERRGDERFLFDAVADDEGYDLARFLSYIMAYVFANKRVRDRYQIRLRATHSPADLSAAGNLGSQVRSLAENSLAGGGIRIIFRMDEAGIDAYNARWPINSHEKKMIAKLPVGCAGIHIDGHDNITFHQNLLTPLQRKITHTTGTLEKKTGSSSHKRGGVFA